MFSFPLYLLFIPILLLGSKKARYWANHAISTVINAYLLWKYPIRHVETGESIPTCRYTFPNGQGDVGKFLEGQINSKKWGSINGPIYRVWSGMKPEIVVTSPEQVKAVFKDSDQHSKAVNNNSGFFLSQLLGSCVGLISGKEWRAVRTSVEAPFSRKSASEHVDLIQSWVLRHMADLKDHGHLPEGILDPAEDLKMLPFWITAEVIYGRLSDQQMLELKQLSVIRENLFKTVIQGGLSRFNFSRYLPSRANKELASFRTAWEGFNNRAYQSSMAHTPTAPIFEMTKLCMSGTLTREQLHHTLDESLFANLDVTTGGISWVLVLLAANKDYQERILSELSANDANNCGDRRQYILSSGTLLAACISEAARLRPLAAFTVPQSLPTPRIVSGYLFPAGTDFIVDTYGLNIRNTSFWGPDAASFRPERFLEHSTERRYHYWRFGFGPRQCMGRYLADFMIRALVVYLVESYELSLLGDGSEEDWGRVPDMWINHPDVKIRCVRRT